MPLNPPPNTETGNPWEVLRARAEEALSRSDAPEMRPTAERIDRLIHELQVHQIELELQNEELRHTQEELHASRDRYADLYDFSPVAYFTVGPKGLIEEANLTAAALLGTEREALIGTPFSNYVDSAREDQDTYYRHRRDALAAEDKHVCEIRLLRHDGQAFCAQLESIATAIDGHERDALRTVAIDVTERKQAEEALREALDGARAADRAKAEFLANMSHEVRTPMSGVLGMVQILSGTPLSPEQRECLENIRLSGKLLLGIVNDVLDLSRIESAGVTLDEVEFALRDAIEDTVHLHASEAHARGLELCCLLSPEVPARVVGDPGRLRQILFNLVGNAVKFTESGQVVVRAEVSEQRGEPSAVRVSVEDTGIGIPKATQRRVFEKFSQADPSSSRGYGGSGLGLAICKKLVRAMGGEISLQSTPGQGSVFQFTVPFAETWPPQTTLPFSGVRALVVEPHPTCREFLMEKLARLGVDTCGADDRSGALQAAAQATAEGRPFRLVLVDRELPDGGGADLVRALGANREPTALGGVLVARFTSLGLSGEAGAGGGSCHLIKPVRERELTRCVTALLAGVDPPEGLPVKYVPSPAARRGRVLLAEDNPVNQQVMIELLKRQGYQTDVVTDGAAAVSAALARPYDLVLMDWQMPKMDGLQATREIRSKEAPDQRVPIVAMTAHAQGSHRAECLAAGMDDYLCKPIEVPDLTRVLERWAAGASSGDLREDDSAAEGGLQRVHRRLAEFRRSLPAETIVKILDTFAPDTRLNVQKLRVAVERCDPSLVAVLAHDLRGTCAVLGTDKACTLLRTLEHRGDQGDLEDAEALLEEVAEELELIEAVVRTEKLRCAAEAVPGNKSS